MKIAYHANFRRQFKKLHRDIQLIALHKEKIFRIDPFDKSLETHKLRGPFKDSWAFSVNNRYRIVFDFVSNNLVLFFAIGTHDIYK